MTRAIILDFDGVVVESNDIKAAAFDTLFADAPGRLVEIQDYHRTNGGISRRVKFRHIHEKILGRSYDAEIEASLAAQFSTLVEDQVVQAPFVPGAREFLDRAQRRYRLFIASGTPESELLRILTRRGLLSFFVRAYGSPTTKPVIIREVCRIHGLRPHEVVFVGDGSSDLEAARETGVTFVARVVPGMGLESCRWRVADLTGLEAVLATIDVRERPSLTCEHGDS